MSKLIRLAAGLISANALLTDSSTLVNNFPLQSDQEADKEWRVSQFENQPLQATLRRGAERGTSKYVSRFSTVIQFMRLTLGMRQFVENTIMLGKPSATVTMFLEHPVDGFGVYQGELTTPFAVGSDLSYIRWDENQYLTVQYGFGRGVKVTTSELLLESGSFILLESGDKILLEQQ